MKVVIDKNKKIMTIEVPLQDPKPSKSGKTMAIAAAQGDTGEKYGENEVYISLNVYYKK